MLPHQARTSRDQLQTARLGRLCCRRRDAPSSEEFLVEGSREVDTPFNLINPNEGQKNKHKRFKPSLGHPGRRKPEPERSATGQKPANSGVRWSYLDIGQWSYLDVHTTSKQHLQAPTSEQLQGKQLHIASAGSPSLSWRPPLAFARRSSRPAARPG